MRESLAASYIEPAPCCNHRPPASRPVSDTVTVAFKVQWTRFAAFESGAYGGGVLRSHPPNLRLDGSEPVSTWTRTEDTDRYSIVLTMRFALP